MRFAREDACERFEEVSPERSEVEFEEEAISQRLSKERRPLWHIEPTPRQEGNTYSCVPETRAPFLPLHLLQRTRRLEGTVLPPLATGTIWSICSPTSSGIYLPHN